MKLYFCFLKSDRIKIEECEVIEKPKTYKPVTKFPRDWCYRCVKKCEVGGLSGSIFCNAVILNEPDIEKAARIFTMLCEKAIIKANESIRDATKDIQQAENKLKMIEEWRNESKIHTLWKHKI